MRVGLYKEVESPTPVALTPVRALMILYFED